MHHDSGGALERRRADGLVGHHDLAVRADRDVPEVAARRGGGELRGPERIHRAEPAHQSARGHDPPRGAVAVELGPRQPDAGGARAGTWAGRDGGLIHRRTGGGALVERGEMLEGGAAVPAHEQLDGEDVRVRIVAEVAVVTIAEAIEGDARIAAGQREAVRAVGEQSRGPARSAVGAEGLEDARSSGEVVRADDQVLRVGRVDGNGGLGLVFGFAAHVHVERDRGVAGGGHGHRGGGDIREGTVRDAGQRGAVVGPGRVELPAVEIEPEVVAELVLVEGPIRVLLVGQEDLAVGHSGADAEVRTHGQRAARILRGQDEPGGSVALRQAVPVRWHLGQPAPVDGRRCGDLPHGGERHHEMETQEKQGSPAGARPRGASREAVRRHGRCPRFQKRAPSGAVPAPDGRATVARSRSAPSPAG